MKSKTLKQNKVNIITLGCSKNLVDSEMLSGLSLQECHSYCGIRQAEGRGRA